MRIILCFIIAAILCPPAFAATPDQTMMGIRTTPYPYVSPYTPRKHPWVFKKVKMKNLKKLKAPSLTTEKPIGVGPVGGIGSAGIAASPSTSVARTKRPAAAVTRRHAPVKKPPAKPASKKSAAGAKASGIPPVSGEVNGIGPVGGIGKAGDATGK